MPQWRLDALMCERHADEDIDFLKVDVEGAEVDVLRGLGLHGRRVRGAAVEVEGRASLDAVRGILESWGLQTRVYQQDEYVGTELYILFGSAG